MSSSAVQKAVYDALIAAGICGGRVYDDVEADVVFPYVSFAGGSAVPVDVSAAAAESDDGSAETVNLDAWSRYAGRKEISDVLAAIKAALHGQSLVVAGRASAHCFVRMTRDFPLPDGKTRHGVVTLEIICRN
jgi:Protein of unknown function (DUF3168)